jgi:gamma-glutamyl phosphate reductase
MASQNGISKESNEETLAKRAKKASLVLGALSLEQRNLALQKIYDTLIQKQDEILAANKKDMEVYPPPFTWEISDI